MKRLQEEMRRTILDANNQIALVTTLAYFGTWARPQEFLQGRGGQIPISPFPLPLFPSHLPLPSPSFPSFPLHLALPSPAAKRPP